MRDPWVALAWCIGVLFLIAVMVRLVRWAKRGGSRTSAMASTLVLMVGLGLAPESDRQRLEEAREDKGKKGGESGDPPDPDINDPR